jgi:hypothetical protein
VYEFLNADRFSVLQLRRTFFLQVCMRNGGGSGFEGTGED